MANGTVKFFNNAKGFGFITPREWWKRRVRPYFRSAGWRSAANGPARQLRLGSGSQDRQIQGRKTSACFNTISERQEEQA